MHPTALHIQDNDLTIPSNKTFMFTLLTTVPRQSLHMKEKKSNNNARAFELGKTKEKIK